MENRYQESNIEDEMQYWRLFAQAGQWISFLSWNIVRTPCKDHPPGGQKAEYHSKICKKERLDQMSQTGTHQGVIAQTAAYAYAEVEDILEAAKKKGEDPFIFVWTILRIPIIWELLYGPPTWQELME